jgi:hypothetical protein
MAGIGLAITLGATVEDFESCAGLVIARLMYGCCGEGEPAQGFFRSNIFHIGEEPMFKKSLSLALAGVMIFTLAVAPQASAETKAEKEAAFAAKVKSEIAKLGVGKQARVAVKLRDKTKLSGYVSQAGEDSFVITDAKTGANTEVPYPSVMQAKGKNLSTGAIIAISVGVAVGVTLLVLYLLAVAYAD